MKHEGRKPFRFSLIIIVGFSVVIGCACIAGFYAAYEAYQFLVPGGKVLAFFAGLLANSIASIYVFAFLGMILYAILASLGLQNRD